MTNLTKADVVRLGRDLGPLATMPTDLRKALYRPALELQRNKWRLTDG
jgi:hypothetical protein